MKELIENKAKELQYFEYYDEGGASYEMKWLKLARHCLLAEFRACIKENEQFLLDEEHNNEKNTECNLWDDHMFAKHRIEELNGMIKEIE